MDEFSRRILLILFVGCPVWTLLGWFQWGQVYEALMFGLWATAFTVMLVGTHDRLKARGG